MARSKLLSADFAVESVDDVFHIINSRQISALMFHNEMANLFDFLTLKGFKRMHEFQFFCENKEHRKTERYYLSRYGKLLPHEEIERVEVIPDDWMQYTRKDVSTSVRKQSVQTAFSQYWEWEHDTKAIFEKLAAWLITNGHVADFNMVNCLVCDVDCELKKLERLQLELKAVDYDATYIMEIQQCIHDKYKEKMKKYEDNK